MSPQAKIVPQKKTTEPMPLGCIFEEGFCSFFVFFLECESKIRVKGGFYAPKAKIVPKKKATEPTPLRCICDKDLFFWSSSPNIFFALTKFSMPPFPAHYSDVGSASMNRSEIGLKIVFLEDHNITSISTVCLGMGEEDLFLFCLEITAFPKLFAE